MLRFHVEVRLCRYAPSPLPAIGSSCPPSSTAAVPCITPIRWYASFHWLKDTHSGVLLQAEPASVACEGWESYASGVPRRGVEHPRGGESELLRSATGWRKEKPAWPLLARLTCCPRGYRPVVYFLESFPRGVGSRPRGEAR